VTAPHLGLFGPGSMTWKLHAEPILWFAGYRARAAAADLSAQS
jgi:hypothetical protein